MVFLDIVKMQNVYMLKPTEKILYFALVLTVIFCIINKSDEMTLKISLMVFAIEIIIRNPFLKPNYITINKDKKHNMNINNIKIEDFDSIKNAIMFYV